MRNGKEEIRFIDLFGGVGGFRLGLELANILHLGGDSERKEASVDGKPAQAKEGDDASNNSERKIFRCVWYNDNDGWAVSVYNNNFGERQEAIDIRGVATKEIPDFDLLCAGFPCQSFSVAGGRKGFKDTRGTLFFEIARILRDKRPAYCLLENVKGLLSHDEGLTFQVILETLDELGYDAEWEVLNSKNFGVLQNRERVFIVGHLRGKSEPEVFPLGESHEVPDGMERKTEKRGKGMENEVASSLDANYWKSGRAGRSMIAEEVSALRDGSKWSDSLIVDIYNARVRKDGLAGTLKGEGVSETSLGTALITGDGRPNRTHLKSGRATELSVANAVDQDGYLRFGQRPRNENGKPQLLPIGYRRIRRLTPIECERLQGFPDNWTKYGTVNGKRVEISDTQRYKMMGNAVTVNVVRAIGERILEKT